MLNCALVDDEEIPRKLLATLLQQVPEVRLEKAFADPLEALAWLQQHPVDLVFLDVEMAPLSGLDLARSLLKPPLIIFTTGHPQYAAEGFDIDAVDYVLKPYRLPRLVQAIQKAHRRLAVHEGPPVAELEDSPTHYFKSGTETYRLRTADIVYIEGASNYAKLHTREGKMLMVYRSLTELEQKLSPEGLVRVHRSFLVNLDQVEKIERHQVWVGNTLVPLGKTYRRQFMERLPES